MSEPSRSGSTFGQRHPVSVTVAIVFVAGFLFGGMFGGVGFLRGALLGGFGGSLPFLVVSAVPALAITLVQSLRANQQGSFSQRFKKNLDGTVEFVIQGWTP